MMQFCLIRNSIPNIRGALETVGNGVPSICIAHGNLILFPWTRCPTKPNNTSMFHFCFSNETNGFFLCHSQKLNVDNPSGSNWGTTCRVEFCGWLIPKGPKWMWLCWEEILTESFNHHILMLEYTNNMGV